MSQGKGNVIDLEPGEDGVFRAVRVSEEKEERPKKEKRQRVTKSSQRREIERIAKTFQGVPEVEQFMYGANAALDLFERVRKAFR